MSTHKVGDWMAIEQGGKVYTGTISSIENTLGTTRYTIDLLADDQYRSKVGPPE